MTPSRKPWVPSATQQAPTPLLEIVILNYDTWDLVARALSALAPFRTCPDVLISVVDNASPTPGLQVEAAFPWVRFQRNSGNLGFAGGNNAAVLASRARYVLLQNSDAFPTPDTINALVAILEGHPDAAAAAPALLDAEGRPQVGSYGNGPRLWRWLAEFSGLAALPGLTWAGFWGRDIYDSKGTEPRQVDWLCGACLLLRSHAFQAVGPLSDAFFMYMEDVEWCERARASGWQILYAPWLAVTHLGGASNGGPLPTRWTRAIVDFIRIRHSATAARAVAATAFLGFAWRSAVRSLAGVLRPALRPRAVALRGYALAFARLTLSSFSPKH